jgi:hypothetical protein
MSLAGGRLMTQTTGQGKVLHQGIDRAGEEDSLMPMPGYAPFRTRGGRLR